VLCISYLEVISPRIYPHRLDSSRLDVWWQKLPYAQISCSKPHKTISISTTYTLISSLINTDKWLNMAIILGGYKLKARKSFYPEEKVVVVTGCTARRLWVIPMFQAALQSRTIPKNIPLLIVRMFSEIAVYCRQWRTNGDDYSERWELFISSVSLSQVKEKFRLSAFDEVTLFFIRINFAGYISYR
jgi:hypothetical protein